MKNSKMLVWFMLLALMLQACNLPSPQKSNTPDTSQALPPGAPTQEAQTPQPQFTATTALTSTPTIPVLTVSQNTNCRTGPSTQYDIVSALLIGQTAEIVGKSSYATDYWVIKNPDGSSTACWLWGQYATVSGNVANLPEITIPPTPTLSPTPTLAPPHAVKNLTANKICIPLVLPTYQYTGTLTWEDKSDNEKGFNIYLNGALFNVAGPNVTAFPIPPLPFPAGTPMKLGVEAFNDVGKALLKEVIIVCP